MYDTIANYNDRNLTPLPNVKIIESTYQVMTEEQVESNDVTFDTFSPERNEREDMINKITYLKANNFGKF